MLICLDADNHIKQRLGGSLYSSGFTLHGTFEAVRVTCGDSTVFARVKLTYDGDDGALTVEMSDAPRGFADALSVAYMESREWPQGLALTLSALDESAPFTIAAPLFLGGVGVAPVTFTVGRVPRGALDLFIKEQAAEAHRHRGVEVSREMAHELAKLAGDYGALVSG